MKFAEHSDRQINALGAADGFPDDRLLLEKGGDDVGVEGESTGTQCAHILRQLHFGTHQLLVESYIQRFP